MSATIDQMHPDPEPGPSPTGGAEEAQRQAPLTLDALTTGQRGVVRTVDGQGRCDSTSSTWASYPARASSS